MALFSNFLNFFRKQTVGKLPSLRRLSCGGNATGATGLVLGLFNDDNDPYSTGMTYTKSAEKFNKQINNKLSDYIKLSGPVPKKSEVRIFYGLEKKYSAVAVVGLGDACVSYNAVEQMDEWKEAIRAGAATGSQALQNLHVRTIFSESFGHAESAAEGSSMGVWVYQDYKKEAKRELTVPRLEMFDNCDYTGWQIGLQKAAAQNLARQLCETPANILTPIAFAQSAVEVLSKAGVNIEVKVKGWSRIMEMNAFLAASSGSCEPPVFLETSYYGCDADKSPVVLIGKGVTFDSGGLCLKGKEEMKHMRGDMAGAAAVIATCRAAAALQLPINIRGLIPLMENLPGTCAMKPGDIVRARNGKSILVEVGDFDGRMALADALSYAGTYNPKFIMDVGTLCKEMGTTMGSAATGVFCNNDQLYEMLRVASIHTGDRIWRMPLWEHFTEKVTMDSAVDVGDKHQALGVPCTAAAFLREFVPACDWVHLDTHGVMTTRGDSCSYLRKGMTGRPTRTIIEFLAQLAVRSLPSEERAEKSN